MKILTFFAVLLIVLLICEAALGASYKCPACNRRMYWTGKTQVAYGKMFGLYKCVANHAYWFRYGNPQTKLKLRPMWRTCPVCRSAVTWTGKTYTQGGKVFKVYKCPNGHVCASQR